MRYIDADKMKSIKSIQSANFNTIETIREWIDAQPTADVRENVRGEWIDRGKDKMLRWQCPECGRKDTHIYNYCPDCGMMWKG